MDFTTAARLQYNRHTFYTILLVGPNGERERLPFRTTKKSRSGLWDAIRQSENLRNLICAKLGAECEVKNGKGCLNLTGGWKIEFGGTIRQEAS